jgi:chemotaxis protein MotA
MDFASLGGVAIAFVGLILGFTLDGGSVTALINPTAALIVFGGTIGVTLTSTTMKSFLGIGKYLKIAFFGKSSDPLEVIEQLTELAQIARREGILALEERVEDYPNAFLQSGIRLILDGVDSELAKSMMETEISFVEERHESAVQVFENAGGFSPTMGIIGTVMGLIHVLGSLQDVTKLGPQIATAFTATLYGVASANVLWLPIANKLKKRNAEELLLLEILMEGILSIQAGENPNILSQKLRAFLAPKARGRKSDAGAGDVNAKTAKA